MMRKSAALLVLCILCLTLLCSGASESMETEERKGWVAKVTTSKGTLSLREKTDRKSRRLAQIPNGSCLLMLKEGTEWCRCEWDGKTGYCATEFLTVLRDADLSLLDYRVLRPGDKGEEVQALKQRLQELGYIRAGASLTNVYSDTLTERIVLFQRQVGMTEDGIASQELQAYLFSDRAPKCSQTLPRARSPVLQEDNGLRRIFCGCCFGEGCECCGFTGWIYY